MKDDAYLHKIKEKADPDDVRHYVNLENTVKDHKKMHDTALLTIEAFWYICSRVSKNIGNHEKTLLFKYMDANSAEPGSRRKLLFHHAICH